MKRQGAEREAYAREYYAFMYAYVEELRRTMVRKTKRECWAWAQDEWNVRQAALRAEKKLVAKEIRDRIT